MDNEILQTDRASDFISSMSSLPGLREIIIFNVSDLSGFYEGVEKALCGLVNATVTVKVYLVRLPCSSGTIRHPDELKLWFNHHPNDVTAYSTIHSYECADKFPNFLLELRRKCRVVLMEERKEGTVVVVHDSYDSSICCDCGRKPGLGKGRARRGHRTSDTVADRRVLPSRTQLPNEHFPRHVFGL